jgi:hypothetical protein
MKLAAPNLLFVKQPNSSNNVVDGQYNQQSHISTVILQDARLCEKYINDINAFSLPSKKLTYERIAWIFLIIAFYASFSLPLLQSIKITS